MPRQQYSRELKIATMRELDGGKSLQLRGDTPRRAQRTMPNNSEQKLPFHRIGAGSCYCSLSDIDALQPG